MAPSARRVKRKASAISPKQVPALPDGIVTSHKKTRKSSSSDSTRTSHYSPRVESPLENLPDELLLVILSHVGEDTRSAFSIKSRRKTYYNLSLTSRRLNRAANDYLYEVFDCRVEQSQPFLRTLIANPQLSLRVKSITWVSEYPWRNPPAAGKPSSSCTRILRERLKDMDIIDRASIIKDYTSDHPGDMLSLAILFAPNLRELAISDYSWGTSGDMGKWPTAKRYGLPLLLNSVNGSSIGKLPSYQHLHTLTIRLGPNSINDLYPVFRLPALRILSFEDIHASGVGNGSITNPAVGFSSIEDLSCGKSYVASSVLSDLILSCRALRRFDYAYCSWQVGPQAHAVHYPTLSRALRKHKDTLEMVDLDDESDRENVLLTMDSRGKLDSFRDFTKLKHLAVPFESITEEEEDEISDIASTDEFDDVPVKLAKFLPPTLQKMTLTVFEDEEHTQFCSDSITMLHSTYLTDVPELGHISVRVHRSVYMRCIDFHDPKMLFLASDVKFNVTQDGVDERDITYSDDELDMEEEITLRSWLAGGYDSEDDFYGYGFIDNEDGDDGEDFEDDENAQDVFEALLGPPPPPPQQLFGGFVYHHHHHHHNHHHHHHHHHH
ncbi:hypothetical protein B0J11DRAFT_151140 [Dendryphion nanum]|uniref:F-box domain-containing protein n=1 Tax=Dendryphion nanum TaxID=256645 RepID=A0A9P9EBX9_9PLEO|nr:hypothetical protein B0J11DRAFT_151140 [Dendryphion nanum]